MMWLTCIFVVSFFALPPAILCWSVPRFRRHFFFTFPLALGFSLGVAGILSAALFSVVPYGWLKFSMVFGGSLALQTLFLSAVCQFSIFREKKFFNARAVVALSLLSILVSLDTGFILQKQGYSDVPGKTYFRPPLHDDTIRHVIVTNSLLRGGDSPLLAGEKYLYQLTWHHLSAVFVSLLPEGDTRYPQIGGISTATAILFSFILMWAFYLLRPAWAMRFWPATLLIILMFTHVDMYHFIASAFEQGKWGIEADWSYAPNSYFRYLRHFSLKLIMLTAPQHAVFFLLLTLFLIFDNGYGFRRTWRPLFSLLTFLPLFIYSPIIAGFFFSIYWTFKSLLVAMRPREFAHIVGVAFLSMAAGWLVHKGLYGFWPHALMDRPGTSVLVFFNREWQEVLQVVLGPFGATGVVGLLAYALFSRGRRRELWPYAVVFLGFFVYYVLVTDVEVRRHYSMVVAFGIVFLFAFELPAFAQIRRQLSLKRVGLVCAVLAILFHGYFIYSYTGKPSITDPNIPWKDYFALNRLLQSKYPKMPVVGAVDPHGTGIDYPIVQEVTASFSMPLHVAVHTKVPPEKFKTLVKIMNTGDVAPYARRLGYRAIIWGPVEQRFWGEKVKKRFIDESKLMARTGSVALYRLTDKLVDRLDPEAKETAAFYYKAAQTFADERWFPEALGYYYRAIELDPNHVQANMGLGKVLELYGRKEEAKNFYGRAGELRKR